MAEGLVRVERSEGGVASVVMCRPAKRNAISMQMMEELTAAFEALAADPAVAVAILGGEGGVFSAGWDRDELLAADPATKDRFHGGAKRFYRTLLQFPKPLVGALGKYVLGTAMDVATFCDVRVCAEDAQIGHAEVRLGGVSLYTPVKALVGDAWARWLVLSGATIDARTAERIGFVTHVCAPAELMATAQQVAAYIAQVPAQTLAYTKAMFSADPDNARWFDLEFVQVMEKGILIKHK